MGKRGPKPKPIAERFHAHYQVDDATGCWNWTGNISNRGYGRFGGGNDPRGTQYAHRVSYELHHGQIPEGLVVDHRCDNKRCVNPQHLQLLTSRENVLRGNSPEMVAYWLGQCMRGHPVTDKTPRRADGRPVCRECQQYRSAMAQAKGA